jgi:hypothetical protein
VWLVEETVPQLVEDTVAAPEFFVVGNCDSTPDVRLVEDIVSIPSFVHVGFSEIVIAGVICSIIPNSLIVTNHSESIAEEQAIGNAESIF